MEEKTKSVTLFENHYLPLYFNCLSEIELLNIMLVCTEWKKAVLLSLQLKNYKLDSPFVDKNEKVASRLERYCKSGRIISMHSLLKEIKLSYPEKIYDDPIDYMIKKCIFWGCYGGHIQIMTFFKRNIINQALFECACEHNHTEIIEYFLNSPELDSRIINFGIIGASMGGHRSIIERLTEHSLFKYSKEVFNQAIFFSYARDKNELAQYLEKKTKLDLYTKTNAVCLGGNEELVKSYFDKKYPIDEYMCKNVCTSGNMKTILYLMENTNFNYNWGLIGASLAGHIEVVKLMIKKGATSYQQAFENAAAIGDLELCTYLTDNFGNQITKESGFITASQNGHYNIVEYYAKYIPNSILLVCVKSALNNGNIEIAKYLMEL